MSIDQENQESQSELNQERAQKILRQSQLIANNSYDAIIGGTLDGIITSWNGGAARMFGYSEDEIIGKSILLLFPPELKDVFLVLMDKIKAKEVIADYDSVRVRKDGSRINVAISLAPFLTEDGSVIGFSAVERDISERKKTENLLRQIKMVVDNSYDAIISTTLDGIITEWNGGAARMFGYSEEEVVGKSGSVLFPAEIWKGVPLLLEKIRAKEVVVDYDIAGLRKDGSRFDLAISISPIVGEGGKVIGASVVERDITERKLAVGKLTENEADLRKAQEIAGIGSWKFDFATEKIHWSDEMYVLYERDKKLGPQTVLEETSYYDPKDIQRLKELIQRLVEKKEKVMYEMPVKLPSGREAFFSAIMFPIINSDGKVTGIEGSAQDITERKKANDELIKLRKAIEGTKEIIFLTDKDGIFTFVNPGFTATYGYAPDEVIGKATPRIIKSGLLTAKEYKEFWSAMLSGKEIRIEIKNKRKDGTIIDIEGSANTIYDENNNIIGFLGIQRDITERKKAERELAESAKKFRIYTEKAPFGIFVCDENGRYLDANPAAYEMIGYTKEELLSKNIVDFLVPETVNEGLQFFDELKTSRAAKSNFLVRRKSGIKFWVNLNAVKIDDHHFMAFCEDISERLQREEHIKELNEVRGKFIDIISHQLRTPLTAINWNLEELLKGNFGKLEDTPYKFLESTHRASTEITDRINMLLTAMDIEEGRVLYVKKEVDLNNLCAQVMNEMLKKCEMRNLSCSYAPSSDAVPLIYGDSEKLRMVIAIFAENAVIYSKDKGEITAKLYVKGDAIRFEVIDTGVGIPQSEQHLILNRFYRASNASAMQPDAFGLGLFVAKNFIEQHHGKLGFESKEGEGSTFWFEIPLKEEALSGKIIK